MPSSAPILADPLAHWIAAALLATLFLHAAQAKWADLSLLEQQLAAYGVPASLQTALARGLPLLELATGVALLTPWRDIAAPVALLLLLAYAAVMAWHRWQGHELDCGCGGEPLSVSWALVARNVALAGLAVLLLAPARPRAMGLGDFAVVVAAVVMAALLYAAFHQVLRSAAHTDTGRRGRPMRRTRWTH